MFVTKRCDVTILRFRNSGIGRKKKTCYKKLLFTLGGFKACRTLRPYAWQQSCRTWQKCVFFPIQSDEIARMPRTREHLQCTGPLYLCLIASIRKAFACLKLVCQLNSQAYCSENRKKTLTIFEVTIFHTIRFLRHVKFYKILHSIRKIDLRCLPMTCTRATL